MSRFKDCEEPTCSDCKSYYGVPDEWAKVPCGWCEEGPDHVRGDDSVCKTGCEFFEWRY